MPEESTVTGVQERRQPDNAQQRGVLDAVLQEREYQRQRWHSDQHHQQSDWLAIMTVWLGKIASEAPPYRDPSNPEAAKAFKKRITQLTAIGLAALEAMEES
jgi:hypothetical protein